MAICVGCACVVLKAAALTVCYNIRFLVEWWGRIYSLTVRRGSNAIRLRNSSATNANRHRSWCVSCATTQLRSFASLSHRNVWARPGSTRQRADYAFSALSVCAEWQSIWAICVGCARVEVEAFALTVCYNIRFLVEWWGRQYSLTVRRGSNAILLNRSATNAKSPDRIS